MDFGDFLGCARYGEFEDLKKFSEIASFSEKQDDSGNTALMFASANGHLEIVNFLLEISRAAVNFKNSSGNTALHWAALTGQTAVVACLLAAGADANLPNLAGDRPFEEALRRQNFPKICEMLARVTAFEEDAEAAEMAEKAGVKLVVSESDEY